MAAQIQLRSEHRAFGGRVLFLSHASESTGTEMRFSVFEPPRASAGPVPMLTWLSGLTCTEETFMIKAGAQRVAAELGLLLVAPDTSPRGPDVPDADDGAWDLGQGAGFYVDASREPWSASYRMYSYVTRELPSVVAGHFAADVGRRGIFGHSMGGHGALVIGLRHPGAYASISAFAPICAPARCPWGQKAFSAYLGDAPESWQQHDASQLMQQSGDATGRSKILVDQGLDDQFLAEQLMPEALESAARSSGYPLELRQHRGYDHSYYFVSSFMEDHLRHHAAILGRT
ncbi:MAG: S-formylglutathione hydrolase [Gammaproteobacteria bacterium]